MIVWAKITGFSDHQFFIECVIESNYEASYKERASRSGKAKRGISMSLPLDYLECFIREHKDALFSHANPQPV